MHIISIVFLVAGVAMVAPDAQAQTLAHAPPGCYAVAGAEAVAPLQQPFNVISRKI